MNAFLRLRLSCADRRLAARFWSFLVPDCTGSESSSLNMVPPPTPPPRGTRLDGRVGDPGGILESDSTGLVAAARGGEGGGGIKLEPCEDDELLVMVPEDTEALETVVIP